MRRKELKFPDDWEVLLMGEDFAAGFLLENHKLLIFNLNCWFRNKIDKDIKISQLAKRVKSLIQIFRQASWFLSLNLWIF